MPKTDAPPMTDNDDLRDPMCDICCRPRSRHIGRDLQCPETVYFRAMPAALSATPIEAMQQRVERLEVALRGLLSSYIGTCRFDGRVISEIEQHHCVIDARNALGDDVG